MEERSAFDDFMAEWDEWEKTGRCGCCRYDKRGYILIDVHPGYIYEVSMDSVQTPENCLDWIFHLNGKTWGQGVLHDFLKILARVTPAEFRFG